MASLKRTIANTKTANFTALFMKVRSEKWICDAVVMSVVFNNLKLHLKIQAADLKHFHSNDNLQWATPFSKLETFKTSAKSRVWAQKRPFEGSF